MAFPQPFFRWRPHPWHGLSAGPDAPALVNVDISELPPLLVGRIEHYFASYKALPGEPNAVEIPWTYGKDHAETVVTAAMEDYNEAFGDSQMTEDS